MAAVVLAPAETTRVFTTERTASWRVQVAGVHGTACIGGADGVDCSPARLPARPTVKRKCKLGKGGGKGAAISRIQSNRLRLRASPRMLYR